MQSNTPNNIASDGYRTLARSDLFCVPCGHRWTVRGKARVSRTIIPWVKSEGMVKACPRCGDMKNIKITRHWSDEMGNGSKKDGGLPPFTVPEGKLRWLEMARSYIGQREIEGGRDNPFVVDCFGYTSYGKKDAHDSVPWCSAFVCRMLRDSGMKDTNNAAAISYADFGRAVELVPGAIVVFKWASGAHHVTFCDRVMDVDYVKCLGGNQDSSVQVSTYVRKYIIAIRWPAQI